ncbi:hypothetical protein EYF80_041637 [Liparis tanakae]|uniref:Uncharacterized protein n=1 Tax=Liparis tanakae TaxID=230148 RepID=A0A4Z2G3M2_9TELE|nr:hypothetical protein EYF80_041637 [Liparis tanakae]
MENKLKVSNKELSPFSMSRAEVTQTRDTVGLEDPPLLIELLLRLPLGLLGLVDPPLLIELLLRLPLGLEDPPLLIELLLRLPLGLEDPPLLIKLLLRLPLGLLGLVDPPLLIELLVLSLQVPHYKCVVALHLRIKGQTASVSGCLAHLPTGPTLRSTGSCAYQRTTASSTCFSLPTFSFSMASSSQRRLGGNSLNSSVRDTSPKCICRNSVAA